jgi:predicted RND superfamily exporter protein
MQRLSNFVRSVGYLILLHIIVVVLIYFMFKKSKSDNLPADVNIQKNHDKEAALLVKNDYLIKEIESKSLTEDSLNKIIETKDKKILTYEKELSKFKTLKNEKHSIIDNYTADQIDSAMSREGFHTYKVQTLR